MKEMNKEVLLAKYSSSWSELNERAPLSPVAGMDMVTAGQAAAYLGVDAKEMQILRQRYKRELDALGMITLLSREVGPAVRGSVRHPDGSYDVPLEDGGSAHIPCGRYTYFTPAAMKRLMAGRQSVVLPDKDCPASSSDTTSEVGGTDVRKMSEVAIFSNPEFGEVRTVTDNGKVLFCGADVAGALGYKRPNDAIAMHCKGTVKRRTLTNRGPQTLLFISQGDIYRLASRSQLSGAEKFESWIFDDVLPSIQTHGAYLTPQTIEDVLTDPDTIIKIATALKEERIRRQELECANENLVTCNDMLAKKERLWEPQKVVTSLVRKYAAVVFGCNFTLGYMDFYRELKYRKGISLKMRSGTGPLIARVRDGEWLDVIAVAAALCWEHGIDPASVINETNAEAYLVSAGKEVI